MASQKEIKTIAESIIKAHDGQMYYNFGEVSKIIGCGINTPPALFHSMGITVKRIGASKRVSAYDIAEVMASERIAPIDNRSRQCT